MRALEFYCGIGGMHYAAELMNEEREGIKVSVEESFDVNPNTNKIYQHNFGVAVNSKSIEHLTLEYLSSKKCPLWMLSPPCLCQQVDFFKLAFIVFLIL